jgi:hypothetical protein
MKWVKGKQQKKRKGKKFKQFEYPWNKWFKRKKFKLVRGEHFDCQMHSMAQQIRSKASAQNIPVQLGIDEKVITVTVLKPKKKKKRKIPKFVKSARGRSNG